MPSLTGKDLIDLRGARTLRDMLKIAPPAKTTRSEVAFGLPKNLIHIKKAKISRIHEGRKGLKRLIKPENARCVLAALPEHEDDRTHCVLRGDFILCDILPLLLTTRLASTVRVSSLSMSIANAKSLASLVTTGRTGTLSVHLSQYFANLDSETVYAECMKILRPHAKVTLSRTHAKIMLVEMLDGARYVFEGSANLRSSDSIENLCIINDPATHDFHAAWMDEIAARPPLKIEK